MPMGKGFTFKTTNDLSTLLLDAYLSLTNTGSKFPPLHIISITNDSIATLLSTAYVNHDNQSRTAAAVILGTGTNATCLCPVSKLTKTKISTGSNSVLVNTEWSISGTLPPLVRFRTVWDETLDFNNEKPGFQPFEEMISGRYLGEIVRLVGEATIFANINQQKHHQLHQKLFQPYYLETQLCSEIEAASSNEKICSILSEKFGVVDYWTLQHAALLKKLVIAVSNRAAALLAAATVGLLRTNGEIGDDQYQSVIVGYSGAVLEKYSTFRERCQKYLDGLVGEGRIRLVQSKQGGIVGAAVLAAMVTAGTT